MKTVAMMIVLLTISACVNTNTMTDAELFHELDRERHTVYLESIYTKYDAEYIDDCLAYEELHCEFE